jgi:phage baseplate assembly protein W
MEIDHPFKLDSHGLSALAGAEDHVRDLIEQVLFTAPGERVNRPTFGCGIDRLVFAPNSDELIATTQFLVQGSLQQWLGHLIHVELVDVVSQDAIIYITVSYRLLRNQQRYVAQISKEVG